MSVTKEQVLSALRDVQDPDLHKDIVSLGFVKDVRIEGGEVDFIVELTTPACPVKDQLKSEAEAKARFYIIDINGLLHDGRDDLDEMRKPLAQKAGDLQAATQGIDPSDFKILLSHDPSHWEDKVIPDALHYHLTLSGHTHGMQFGIEIPGWVKWSPVKWRYKYWAGIYEELGQFINVNRGFGFLGYPGRVGIWPEITVITLRKTGLT